MNPDADPKLEALFAVPMQDTSDDARALAALLTRLESTDRRRSVILTVAGVTGAAMASVVLALGGILPALLEGLSSIGASSLRGARLVSEWSLAAAPIAPETLALGFGLAVLAGAAALVFRRAS